MLTSNLFTANEAAKLLRVGRRAFDAHVARGDIAYIAVGMGLKRIRKRFDPEDLARFRERQRRVECPSDPSQSKARASASKSEGTDFAAILRERRAEKRATREKAQRA
ncbi:helix-turn-helix domain-containing protein [Methylobacterium sp. J-067]|uniref:helix-turn-helix domain-containing protein n=1 Tax=Methylobacterium sp. J-067 TaxID=2836648 RepID=UPI001FB9F8B1|nr:helix-turn-helix domain-containing protein [Methylobacterium sp. J-067]MCJ2023126.1 helix-turn-helix domain-containing protein [Methylobacterium sp. J-067]